MGKRGPQPQPAELKKLRGNPGKRALPNTPVGQPLCPACPEDLKHIKKTWDYYGGILANLGILRDTDGIAYEIMWRTWSAYLETLTEAESVRDQLVVIRALLPLLDRFGMNPSSRSSLNVEAPPKESEFEKFVKRTKTG